METWVLAVHPNARELVRDLKDDRQPVIVWFCNPSFHVLEGFLVCFSLIKNMSLHFTGDLFDRK